MNKRLPRAAFLFFDYRIFERHICEHVVNRSKKIFLAAFIVFMVLLGMVSYDIGSRTTFPGSKPQLKERLKNQYAQPDSAAKDSLKSTQR